jgi:hypothetical protein
MARVIVATDAGEVVEEIEVDGLDPDHPAALAELISRVRWAIREARRREGAE